MYNGNRSDKAQSRRLGWVVAVGTALAISLLFASTINGISIRREALQQIAESQCPHGDNKPCQSVHADIQAARAADDMVDLAIWQFIAGVVGIVFVGLTLRATHLALREANEATEAARKAVEVTEEGNRRQLQAYVHIERAEIKWGDIAGSEPRITLFAKNTGQTPARWFGIVAKVETTIPLLGPPSISFESVDLSRRRLHQWSALGGLSTLSLPGIRTADHSALHEAFTNQTVIHIVGVVRYETLFGEMFETEFWFTSKPRHRYRAEPSEAAAAGVATYGTRKEAPRKMQRAAVALRTYRYVGEAQEAESESR